MSTNSDTTAAGSLDWLKWVLVIGILGAGIFGNWYYQDQSVLYRVIAMIVLGGSALAIAIQTEKGGNAWSLMKEARGEIRRVVWPTRDETMQTTMIVLVLVLIFALILWALDSGLSLLVRSIIG